MPKPRKSRVGPGTLVDELVARADAEELGSLARSDDPTSRKAARAAVHRLRCRGVSIDLPRAQRAAPRAEQPDLQGILTPYDERSQRLVWLPQPRPGGLKLHRARISAKLGLLDLQSDETSRRQYRSAVAELRQLAAVVSVDAETARWFVHDAARRRERAGHALPDGFLRASGDLGRAPDTPHPALQLEPAPLQGGDLLELYELPELQQWIPEQDALQEILLRQQEVATSRLMVDDGQRQLQARHAMDRSIDGYYTDERRQTARTVLLDTVHLLLARGKPEPAARLRAAADLYELPREQLLVQPFVRHFVGRVCDPAHQREPDANELADEALSANESAGLILPGSGSDY